MRSPLLVVTFIALVACGGGQSTREAAQSPDTPSTIASTPPGSDAASATPNPSDAAAAPASADTVPSAKPLHTHDPGRGIDDINAIVKAHRDEARACYDKAFADHPGIEGDLVITWTVDPKGKVTQTALDMSRSTIVEPTVVACVSGIIQKIQFAPSPGGFETKASFPFNFHPKRVKQAQ